MNCWTADTTAGVEGTCDSSRQFGSVSVRLIAAYQAACVLAFTPGGAQNEPRPNSTAPQPSPLRAAAAKLGTWPSGVTYLPYNGAHSPTKCRLETVLSLKI